MDYDKMEFKKFTKKAEIDKFLNMLKGLLCGISIDNKINDKEIDEFRFWCSLLGEYAERKPFSELIPMIRDALDDNILTTEEVEDINWVIDNFTSNSKNVYYDAITHGLQTLHGIIHGILSDNTITDTEIINVKKWINDNEHLSGYYPYDEISTLLTSILQDGLITEDERNILKVYLSEFINRDTSLNIDFSKIDDLKNDYTINGICAIDPSIEFIDKTFCFTGASNKATRKEFENLIISLGGNFSNSVTKKTDYLIVGNNGNTCWAYSCYGRKVEQAMDKRKKGQKIIILHENDFWDSVEDTK